jgi:hypothetical protein
MAFRDLFLVVKAEPVEKGAAVAAAAPGSSEGVFLSAKSLMSFPIASGAVSIVWKLLQHFWGVGDVVVLYISLIVGGVIFLIVISDDTGRPRRIADWIVSILIALLNSLLLAASALGLVKDVLGSVG